ncbi:peptidase M14 [Sporanaerobium hydrogeniformans]|uniref:Peptidase M14 n=1 Tax=Sporanaerobium hydrogeniformans TaxID=3072179 RepID=A0AC61DEY8_9FIRM|nr:M14 family metallocarboxypeptidase [Sporanaerobium hydrogeniformans]PHV71465.1 peptidase M14 [Sporanaerobium hydrogeniformans]
MTLFIKRNNKQGVYDVLEMEKDLKKLTIVYPFFKKSICGKSTFGNPLYLVRIGKGSRKIHINGSHHGNEWLTSLILIESMYRLSKAIQRRETLYGIDAYQLLEKVTYDFVPMVNPDGVQLCAGKLPDGEVGRRLKEWNQGLEDFTRWKANGRGVDLNRNYNAGFIEYTMQSKQKIPSYAYFAGPFPESEKETKALADLTRRQKYDLVLAYHSQGQVIYWNYKALEVDNGLKYAKMFSEASGYQLDTPEPEAASGGYKDWFIETFQKPGYTIECGLGENPLPLDQLEDCVKATLPILVLASKDLRKED